VLIGGLIDSLRKFIEEVIKGKKNLEKGELEEIKYEGSEASLKTQKPHISQ